MHNGRRPLSRKPNILWICPDMLRYDAIGSLGNPYISTPNMDRLVSEGVAFTRAYCQNPVCTPSRASFLTGRYPFATGVVANGNECFPSEEKLVTKTLAEAGYDCGLVGKLHLAAAFERKPLPDGTSRAVTRTEVRAEDGYRVFHWNHDPMNVWQEGDEYHRWIERQGVNLAELRKNGAIPEHLHQSTWCADRAIDFIEREGNTPWLLSVNMFHPHGPWDVPIESVKHFDVDTLPGPLFRESDLGMQNDHLKDVALLGASSGSVRPEEFPNETLNSNQGGLGSLRGNRGKLFQAAQWACVELVDRQIGRILGALAASGQAENTVVILHADHGQPFGDHGILSTGCRFYECITHIPLVFSWPQHFMEGLRARGLVELIDLAPTLHDLLGLPVPEEMHGQSLLPVLSGRADPDTIKEGARCEYYFSSGYFSDRRAQCTYGTMYRDERYKLCVYHGVDVGELYDLENDPGEFDNLWDSPEHADIKHRLLKKSFDRCMLTIDRGPRLVGHA